MKILGYRGKSLVSRAIRFQTRSAYSHIGIRLRDGSVVEAWLTGPFGGEVRHGENFSDGHKPGTPIDVYRIDADFDEDAAEAYLLDCVGQGYALGSVLRFVSRRDATSGEKKFCSELFELAMLAGGLKWSNGRPSHHSPRDTLLVPYAVYETTVVTL